MINYSHLGLIRCLILISRVSAQHKIQTVTDQDVGNGLSSLKSLLEHSFHGLGSCCDGLTQQAAIPGSPLPYRKADNRSEDRRFDESRVLTS